MASFLASLVLGFGVSAGHPAGVCFKTITELELKDKLEGFWVGQLVGNFMGLPFEFVYWDEPMPALPDRYYDEQSAREAGLRCNTDGRGSIPARLDELQSAYTDDDTDVEFVTLHAVEEHGLGITYPEIAAAWRTYVHIHVNGQDALWFANKVARELMDRGMLPPSTGSQEHNLFWWTIDPQLVNEIWSAFHPGMLEKAVERAEWGAEITSSSWGTHPTRFYAALYSAAFFESDVQRLYDIAMRFIPESSPYLQGLQEVRSMYASQPEDWRSTRQSIKEKYFQYPENCGGVPWENGVPWSNCGVSAMINGLMGAMALLYGGGDFMRTVGIAIAAGFDCDNQAATLAGLLGVLHGGSQIPTALTLDIAGNHWAEPFNDRYVNERRPPLPRNNSNSEIVSRIMSVARTAILQHGGVEEGEGGNRLYQWQVSSVLCQDSPAPPPSSQPQGCCQGCIGRPFCSDGSKNCYDTKRKDYYRSCGPVR
ncbi:unnamed protein product [Polarella glacialis]|uniref:ADP-ribosylglycohydrolase n=1 Tax=Polarella glacialis TaxID=89957 RepID=A0A813E870_POLGL|nr:unnamed protein product [Polarella glacialis]